MNQKWIKNALGENLPFGVGPLVAKKKKKWPSLPFRQPVPPTPTLYFNLISYKKKVRSNEWARAQTHRGCS